MAQANKDLISHIAGLGGIDRDIALEIHGEDFSQYGEKTHRAFMMAVEKPSFSRLEALDRMVSQAVEGDDFLFLAIAMLD